MESAHMKNIGQFSPLVAANSGTHVKILALAVAAFALPTPQTLHAAVLEEVIVTAQKREQSNQDVPISITALGAETIERRGIQNTEDLIGQIPGVGGFTAPG